MNKVIDAENDEFEKFTKCRYCDLFKNPKYPCCWRCYVKRKIPIGYINYIS